MTNPHESESVKAVALLGAGGTMGKGMARNAAAADLPIHAWNRTAGKLDDLAAADGIEAFATAREAVVTTSPETGPVTAGWWSISLR